MDGFLRFRTFFYVVYAVILTAALLYLRFPAEKFKLFCERHAEYFISDSDCSIEGISYRFPLSLVFANVQISREVEGKRSNFRFDHFTVIPHLSTFFRTFDLNGQLYKGSFAAKLTVDAAGKNFQLDDILIQGLDMAEWGKDLNFFDRKISGTARISGNYQAEYGHPREGMGKGKLVAVQGDMELLQPVLSLSSVEFERIAFDMAHEKGVLSLTAGQVLGKEINADFTGEMMMSSPLLNSIILLNGHLTPKEEFLTARPEEKKFVEQMMRRYKKPVLPFKVGGSLRRPTFRFSL